jgi:hypothetical protein
MVTPSRPWRAVLRALPVLAWLLVPGAVPAAVVTVKNLTADAMSVCSMVRGAATCFSSTEVPAYGTTSLSLGTSCLERWKVTRVRDSLALSGPPARSGCGDLQLLIRPDGPRFTVGSP